MVMKLSANKWNAELSYCNILSLFSSLFLQIAKGRCPITTTFQLKLVFLQVQQLFPIDGNDGCLNGLASIVNSPDEIQKAVTRCCVARERRWRSCTFRPKVNPALLKVFFRRVSAPKHIHALWNVEPSTSPRVQKRNTAVMSWRE